jgi:uncharacterized protein (TIGR02265 family)
VSSSSEEQTVWSHTVEGLFLRALANDVPAPLRESLKGLGLDLSKKLMPAYPVPLWNQVLETTARAIYPELSLDAATQRLGERMIEGYRETLVGQAVLAMARLIGPRRTLLRSRQNWRSGNNYSEVSVTELAPNDFRLEFNEAGVSRWVSQGLLRAGLTFAGAKELVVDLERHTETSATYRLRWK